MTKTKKNKSILKRILAFLGAGVCALACFLCFSSNSISVYADDKFQTFTYVSNVENIKVTNYTSFSENIVGYPIQSSFTSTGITFNFDNDNQTLFLNGELNSDEHSHFWFFRDKIIPKGVYQVYSNSSITYARSMMYFVQNNISYWLVSVENPFGLGNGVVEFTEDTKVSFCFEVHKNHIGQFNNYAVNVGLYKISSPNDRIDYFVPYQQNELFSLKTTFGFLPSGELVDKFNTFVQFDMYSDYYDYKFSSDNKMTMNMSDMVHYDTLFDFCSYYYDSAGVLRKYSDKKFFINFFNLDNDSGQLFNGDVIKIVKGSYLNYKTYYSDDIVQYYNSLNSFISKVNNKFNFISFVAKNGASINIVIPLASDFENDYFPLTTYYLEGGISDSYNDGFSNGQLFGYENGYKKGNSDGYNDGFSKGKNVGFENGYSKGISESNDYTFLGLISACIDAPITYFTSLFNFELLGVNLSAFLTGLFTLCVIVTIVKLCLGGK